MTIKKKTVFKTFIIVVLITATLGYIVVENVLPYAGIKPYKINAATLSEFKNGVLPSDYGLDFEPFDIQTKDSLIPHSDPHFSSWYRRF
jgi:hypothetical protein